MGNEVFGEKSILHPAGKITQYTPPRVFVTPPSFPWTSIPSTCILNLQHIWLGIHHRRKQGNKFQVACNNIKSSYKTAPKIHHLYLSLNIHHYKALIFVKFEHIDSHTEFQVPIFENKQHELHGWKYLGFWSKKSCRNCEKLVSTILTSRLVRSNLLGFSSIPMLGYK